jgi:osmoprotectant transport system substrate-binding protein
MAALPPSAHRLRTAGTRAGGPRRVSRRALAAALLLLALAPCAAKADTITVASKIDTEGSLLGNMIVLLLEKGGLTVRSRIGLGPTNIVRSAILAGAIDLYPEYTGNGARFFKSEDDPVWKDATAGYDEVRKLDAARNNLVWLAPAPANNTWAIAAQRDLAARAGPTLEDFSRYVAAGGRVRLAASAEFVESPGGLPAFEASYRFTLGQSQLLVLAGGDTAATIRAASEGISGVNAAMAYGTDGSLAALGLTVFADDKGAEVVYEPAPVVRAAVLAAHPEIATLLDPAFRSLTLARLQKLNAEIAVEGRDARAVAKDYLAAQGFLK